MMDVRYKRDLNSNYMIMTDAEKREEIYEDRMITENRIYGFLPCVEQKKEKQTEYFYEITGRQSMELLYERRKVSYEQLVDLLKDLLQILNASEEYLLNADHFVYFRNICTWIPGQNGCMSVTIQVMRKRSGNRSLIWRSILWENWIKVTGKGSNSGMISISVRWNQISA